MNRGKYFRRLGGEDPFRRASTLLLPSFRERPTILLLLLLLLLYRNKLAIGRLPPLSSSRVSSNAASSIVRLIVENRRSTSRLFETDSHVESALRSDPIGRYTEYSNDNDFFFFFLTVAWMDPAGWIERRIETKADTTGSRNIRKRRPNATPIINNGRSTIATSNARRPCRASLRGNGASGSSVKHCR